VLDREYMEMVEEITESGRILENWEEIFLRSVKRQNRAGRPLIIQQRKIIRGIYQRTRGMGNGAC